VHHDALRRFSGWASWASTPARRTWRWWWRPSALGLQRRAAAPSRGRASSRDRGRSGQGRAGQGRAQSGRWQRVERWMWAHYQLGEAHHEGMEVRVAAQKTCRGWVQRSSKGDFVAGILVGKVNILSSPPCFHSRTQTAASCIGEDDAKHACTFMAHLACHSQPHQVCGLDCCPLPIARLLQIHFEPRSFSLAHCLALAAMCSLVIEQPNVVKSFFMGTEPRIRCSWQLETEQEQLRLLQCHTETKQYLLGSPNDDHEQKISWRAAFNRTLFWPAW
jgi:hypothetical protein